MEAYERTVRDRLIGFLLFQPCLVLAALAAGILGGMGAGSRPPVDFDSERVVEVTGWVSGAAEQGPEYSFFPLTPLQVTQAGRTVHYPGDIAVYLNREEGEPAEMESPLVPGDRIRLRCYLNDPTFFAVPGVADMRDVYWTRGFQHVARLKSVRQIEMLGRQPGTTLLRGVFSYRRQFIEYSRGSLSARSERLARSAFLGERRVLDGEDRRLIRRLGIIHLFVVSGFHVSLVALAFHFFFGAWGWAGRLLTMGGLWGYIVMTGASLPTLRAGLMTTAVYVILSFGFKAGFLNVLGAATLALLVCRPASLGDAGFQFSVVSLLTIGLFVAPRRRRLQSFFAGIGEAWSERVVVVRSREAALRRRTRFWCEEKLAFLPRRLAVWVLPRLAKTGLWLGGLWLVGIAVWTVTLPLALQYSNLWVWGQAWVNLLLVPLFSGFVMLSMLLFVLFSTPLAPLPAALVDGFGRLLWNLMEALQPVGSAAYWPQPGSLFVAGYLIATLLAGVLLRRLQKGVLLLPLLLGLLILPPSGAGGKLVITMLDVGQGESIHLRYPGGSHGLVDSGGFRASRDPYFVGERIVGRYLWEERVGRLDYALLSHPHTDHTQGWRFLRRVFPTARLFVHDSDDYPDWPSVELEAGEVIDVEGVLHRVLHPHRADSETGLWKTNDASLVMRLEYGCFSMLLAGDIEIEAELSLVRGLEPVSVLKAAHHGGRKSNSRLILERLRPAAAIISAGRRNPFGHPSEETLERLRETGARVFVTSRDGSLRVETDGGRCRISGYSIKEKRFVELMDFAL